MRIAITGGTGLLGTALVHALSGQHDVLTLSSASEIAFGSAKNANADIRDAAGLRKAMNDFKPEAVVHAAAQTNVDWCESHFEEALDYNARGTENVARYCLENNARLIHISTDYVFDGKKKGGRYTEEDAPHPISKYGESKLEGEKTVQRIDGDYLILRTTMYGWNVRGKKNYAMIFYDALSASQPVKAFRNQFNTPMFANDFADVIAELLGRSDTGVLHAGCSTRVSRPEFARTLAQVFGFDESLVEEVDLTDDMMPAPRPRDCSLYSGKLEALLGRGMPSLREGLERFKRLRDEGYAQRFRIIRG